MAGSKRWAAKLAVGGAAAALPIAVATPAGAAYRGDDYHDVSITLVRDGPTISCKMRGRTSYEFPVGDTDDARITSVTVVGGDDPRCEDAVYQTSLSGSYETAPDSGGYVHFGAQGTTASGSTPGDWGALTTFLVPGPTGHIGVTHRVLLRCDDPPAGASFCTFSASTSPK